MAIVYFYGPKYGYWTGYTVVLHFDLGHTELDGPGVAVGGEGVDPGATGVAEAEEFGDLVKGFARRVVERAADIAVGPGVGLLAGEVEVGVATTNDQGEDRELEGGLLAFAHFKQDGVDVALEVVDGNEGLAEGKGQGFGVGDAHEQGAGEAGAFGDCNGVQVGELNAGTGDGFADDGDDIAQVLAGGEFGDHASVDGVHGHLGGDDVGERLRAGAHDSGCGFVAGALNTEDQTGVHLSMIEDREQGLGNRDQ